MDKRKAAFIHRELNLIAKELQAAEKQKWSEMDGREQYAIIQDLVKKHNLDKDYDPLKRKAIDIVFKNGGRGENRVEANVNWPTRGAHSIEDAEKFAKGLSDAIANLKKAAEELKRQYPEVKIVEQISY